jgi:GTPase involved in cell partitioning and DNA repair
MLIHVVDASCFEGRYIIDDYEAIRNELTSYPQTCGKAGVVAG